LRAILRSVSIPRTQATTLIGSYLP